MNQKYHDIEILNRISFLIENGLRGIFTLEGNNIVGIIINRSNDKEIEYEYDIVILPRDGEKVNRLERKNVVVKKMKVVLIYDRIKELFGINFKKFVEGIDQCINKNVIKNNTPYSTKTLLDIIVE